MKFSERWVREWADPPGGTDALAARLTRGRLRGANRSRPVAGRIEGVAIAEVVGVEPAPGRRQAVDLHRRRRRRGDAPRRLRRAQRARRACARRSRASVARLPDGSKIRKSRIRGETSQGMLCSARELGLGEEADGILDLALDAGVAAPPGTDLAEALALDDTVIEGGGHSEPRRLPVHRRARPARSRSRAASSGARPCPRRR